MDHIVYLDHKAKELDNLASGRKSMIIRGAMGRKMPYGRVFKDDVIYFIENNGDGLVKARAIVEEVITSDKLSKEDSIALVNQHKEQLCLNPGLEKRFSGKRYLVLITIKSFLKIDPFQIDRSAYGNMDDWLPVERIEKISQGGAG